MRRTLLLAVVGLAACGPTEPSWPEGTAVPRGDAIVGGTVTAGDPDVFMLFLRADNGQASLCTATLIAPQTLLTAAHCVDPRILNASRVTIVATNAPAQNEVLWGTNTWRIAETRMHPSWNPAVSLEFDIALARLERPAAGVTPRPWNSRPLDGFSGRPARAVGYGSMGNDVGSGQKRTVDLSIRQVRTTLVDVGNQVDKGICHGDSGGPTFHTFSDGVERVIGVHSFTRSETCVDGADTRVDAYASFIRTWLSEKEDMCGPNSLCAAKACAVPDPDCVPQGGACQGVTDCAGRVCMTDGQHADAYCSKACTSSADCGPGFDCWGSPGVCRFVQLPEAPVGSACTPEATWCLGGSVCTGRAATEARCLQPCQVTAECPNPQRCVTGFDGRNACADPPPIILRAAKVEGPAPGCASTGLMLPMWAAAALLLRRRSLR